MKTLITALVLMTLSLSFSSSVEATPILANPEVLLMQYVGGGIADSSNTQDPSKWYVNGSSVTTSPVFIEAYTGSLIYFSDSLNLDEFFLIDAATIGLSILTSETNVDIYADSSKGSLLQEILFHTSLSQPLNVGDQFGAIQIVGYIDENGNGTSPPLPAPIPEPSTFLLLGAGLAGFGFVVRRRRKG